MALTREQIFQAADDLAAQGQNPTLAAVRKLLGSGSYTTIQEVMQEWRAARTARSEPMREPAPRAVAERLETLGAEIWATALELAHQRLTAEREAFEVQRLEMERRQVEAAELADQMVEEVDSLQAALEAERASRASEQQHWVGFLEKSKTLQAAAEERAERDRARLLEVEHEAVQAREELALLQGKFAVLSEQNRELWNRLGPETKKARRGATKD